MDGRVLNFTGQKMIRRIYLKIHTADGLIKYVTDEGILLSESEALNLIHTNNYEKSGTGEGTGIGGNEMGDSIFSRAPSTEYVLFTEVNKKR